MSEGFTAGQPEIRQFTREEMRSNAALPRIDRKEILDGDRVLKWLTGSVGFSDWRQVIALVVSITVPFLAFAMVASYEGRFSLASVKHPQQIGKEEVVVLGMSFLGDPMVWPYFILVPLTILLFKNATKKLADFFFEVRAVVNPAWALKNAAVYEALVEETRDRLAGQGAWRWGPRLAATIAVVFWLWNGLVCTYPQYFETYRSAHVFVQKGETWKELDVPEEMDIKKWDAEIAEAPFSWGLARIWVLFGYGVVPFVLAKLIAMVVALSYFCKGLIQSRNPEDPEEPEPLNIQPLAADRAGGLSCLADAALAIIYTLLPVLLMVFAAFFKEGTPPSGHNYLLMAAFLPVMMVAFGVPVSTVHAAMEKTKRAFLTRISHRFNLVNQALLQHLESGNPDKERIQTLDRSIQTLQGLYQQVDKMPVWPLELGRGLKFAGALLAPIVLTVVKVWMEPLVRSYLGSS